MTLAQAVLCTCLPRVLFRCTRCLLKSKLLCRTTMFKAMPMDTPMESMALGPLRLTLRVARQPQHSTLQVTGCHGWRQCLKQCARFPDPAMPAKLVALLRATCMAFAVTAAARPSSPYWFNTTIRHLRLAAKLSALRIVQPKVQGWISLESSRVHCILPAFPAHCLGRAVTYPASLPASCTHSIIPSCLCRRQRRAGVLPSGLSSSLPHAQ